MPRKSDVALKLRGNCHAENRSVGESCALLHRQHHVSMTEQMAKPALLVVAHVDVDVQSCSRAQLKKHVRWCVEWRSTSCCMSIYPSLFSRPHERMLSIHVAVRRSLSRLLVHFSGDTALLCHTYLACWGTALVCEAV